MKSRRIALVLAGLVLTTAAVPYGRQSPAPAGLRNLRAVTSPAAEGSAEPNLTTDERGRAWLSWLEPKPGGHRFRFASLNGTAWSAPSTIAEGTNFVANWADFPSLFVARDGTMAAHWLERGESRGSYGIRVRTSRDRGRTWTPAVTPHRDASAAEHGFVSFYDAPGGGVGLVWLDGRAMAGGNHGSGSHAAAMALRSTVIRNGSAGEDALIDARVCDCCQTSAARTTDAVLVAYRDRSEKEIRDTAVVRFADGTWSEPVTVHADNWEITGCPVNGPAITTSGNSAAVAWFTSVGDQPKTLVAFSNDGGRRFASPIRIDTSPALGRLAMVMLSPDRVLVSSLERTASGAAVVLRDVRRNGQVSAPFQIAQVSPDRSSGFLRLTRSGSTLVMAWTDVRAGAQTAVRTAVAEVR